MPNFTAKISEQDNKLLDELTEKRCSSKKTKFENEDPIVNIEDLKMHGELNEEAIDVLKLDIAEMQ
eukprot:12794797-Heterocapsa_arctica.AAC.1